MPQPFRSDDKLSLDAAREQLALCMGLYFRDTVAINELLRVGGKDFDALHIFYTPPEQANPLHVVPSYLICRQDGATWIVVAGTENLSQWMLNVRGVMIAEGWNGDATPTHKYFAHCADEVWLGLVNRLPQDMRNQTVNISGHSLGGATARLLAQKLLTERPGARVRVMTFGEPKSQGAGYSGVAPISHDRIVNNGDLVASVPPGNPVSNVSYLSPLADRIGIGADWRHYGDPTYLQESGIVTTQPPQQFAVTRPSGWGLGMATSHYATAYYNSLKLNARQAPLTQSTIKTELIIDGLIQMGRPEQVIAQSDPLQFFDPATANARLFDAQGGPMTKANVIQFAPVYTAAAGSVVTKSLGVEDSGVANWKIDMLVEMGNRKWNESWYMYGKGDEPNPEDGAVQLLWTTRAALLVSNARINEISVTNMDTKFQSAPLLVGGKTPQPNAGNPAGGINNVAVVMRMYNADRTGAATHYLRGFPNTKLADDLGENSRQVTTDPDWQKRLDALASLVTNQIPLFGGFGFRYRPKSALARPQFQITEISKDGASGRFTIVAPLIGLQVNDEVIIKGTKGAGVKGILGRSRVKAVTSANTYLLVARSCNNCPVRPKKLGTVAVANAYTVAPCTLAQFTCTTTRDTGGRGVGTPRGRSKAKCCK